MALIVWQTPTGAARVLAPYPVTVADLHAAENQYGVRRNVALGEAISTFARLREPEHRGFVALAAPADAIAWAVEVADAARGTAAELPPRRDAVCPACGQRAAAPDPLPDGWRCDGPHGIPR